MGIICADVAVAVAVAFVAKAVGAVVCDVERAKGDDGGTKQ